MTSIGVILSGSTTDEAVCQLLKSAEKGRVQEGTLLVIQAENQEILTRVGQIIPYNDFYTQGSAWSEPLRHGLPIPEEVARQYEICKLELLGAITLGEISNIRSPPRPGDQVVRIDPKLHQEKIFGSKRGDKGLIWYGSITGYEDIGVPIPLDVEQIPMHLAIFGTTGSGKSFDAGALIEQFTKIPASDTERISFPLIIIDAHGDYVDYVDYMADGNELGAVQWIHRYIFPDARLSTKFRNPKYRDFIYPLGVDLNQLSPRELATMVILYYRGHLRDADLQITTMENLLAYMDEQRAINQHDAFHTQIQDLRNEVTDRNSGFRRLHQAIHPATAAAVSRAIEKFERLESQYSLLSAKETAPMAQPSFIEEITEKGGIVIIDFSAEGAPGVDLETKQFLMSYLAGLLLQKFTMFKQQGDDRYLLFMIEEAQNFCPSASYEISESLAKSKLRAIATQGRKFGLSLCLISQRPSFVDRIVLSMCNTFFIHRISPEDVHYVKSVTGGLPPSVSRRLTNLDVGELIVNGQMTTVPFHLLIKIDGDVPGRDREVKPTIGKINVVDNLLKKRKG